MEWSYDATHLLTLVVGGVKQSALPSNPLYPWEETFVALPVGGWVILRGKISYTYRESNHDSLFAQRIVNSLHGLRCLGSRCSTVWHAFINVSKGISASIFRVLRHWRKQFHLQFRIIHNVHFLTISISIYSTKYNLQQLLKLLHVSAAGCHSEGVIEQRNTSPAL